MIKTLVGMGDSLMYSNLYGLTAADHSLYQAKKALTALGANLRERNIGRGGDTTAMMMGRRAGLLYYGVPDLAILYGGANDRATQLAIAGAGGATTTVLPLVAGGGAYLAVDGYVIVGGETRQVGAIAADTITLTAALSVAPAAGATVWADTRRNLFELGKYARDAGCPRVLVGGSHYKNWTSGGDTTSAQESLYAALRVLQAAAAADIDALSGVEAIYSDRYAWMRAMIVAGTVTQGSNAWSAYADNQHLNAAGHAAIAACDMAAIQGRSGWLAAVKS